MSLARDKVQIQISNIVCSEIYHFCTIMKSKNRKSKHHKLETILCSLNSP